MSDDVLEDRIRSEIRKIAAAAPPPRPLPIGTAGVDERPLLDLGGERLPVGRAAGGGERRARWLVGVAALSIVVATAVWATADRNGGDPHRLDPAGDDARPLIAEASITPAAGPVGTEITVTGIGVDPAELAAQRSLPVHLVARDAVRGLDLIARLGDAEVRADGTFTLRTTIPAQMVARQEDSTAPVSPGRYDLAVGADPRVVPGVSFTVTADPAAMSECPRDQTALYLIEAAASGEIRAEHLLVDCLDRRASDPAQRVLDALEAAAHTERVGAVAVRSPLSEHAMPTVTVSGELVVLDWSSTAAANHLAAWSTAMGGTGLRPIHGMVFENVPEAKRIEHRLDGSCQRFTELMQGSGCDRPTRSEWLELWDT